MRQPWHDADLAGPTRLDRDSERPGQATDPATRTDEDAAGDSGDTTVDTEAIATGGGEHHGLAPGTQLHRYVILGHLGSGGMGAVYRAHDPRLERDIAIKLVHVHHGTRSARTRHRLLREAQALAQLSHPNVVAVHDVGEFEDSIFIAMELVVGQTVRHWLRQAPRDQAAILDVFLAVGSGLDAAHRAGLVHRDIKPDNLIIGEDGRVRILDFGLARIAMDVSSDSVSGRRSAVMPAAVHEASTAVGFLAPLTEDEPDTEDDPEATDDGAAGPAAAVRALDTPLTRTGAILGTPAYMAPEQIQSGAVDARTDQFTFCVCLYEALYGTRPFEGESIEALFAAVLDGRLGEPPANRRVPGWLRAALVRGLEVDPGRRWPTMHALLGALRRGRERRKQRWLAVGAGLLVLSAVAAIAGYHSARTDVCSGASEHLRGVWDEDRRAALAQAFQASGAPFAAESLTRLTQILDRYSGAWAAAHTDACEATAVRQEQSIEVLDQRMECLAGRRRALGELVSVLSEGDATTLKNSLRAAAGLPRIEACADLEYVRSSIKPPEDPAVAAQVTLLRDKLARVHQLDATGNYEKGLALASEIQAEAAPIDYRPLQIEIDVRLGSLQDRQGAFADARTSLERAFFAAQEIQYTRAALEAATLLTWVVGYSLSKPADGHGWARHAEALLGRGGSEEERAALLTMQGMAYNVEGQTKRAEECHRKALAIREKVLGPDHPDVVHSLNNLGMSLIGQSRNDEARASFERALALGQATLGPEHPAIAQFLGNIGIAVSAKGDYEQAATYHRKALAILQKMLPPDHPEIARSLDMLATEHFYLGKYAEAEASYRKALEIREKALGPDHPDVGIALNALGAAVEALRRLEEAEALYRRSLALNEKVLGPDHPDVALSLSNLGIVANKLGRFAEAETYYVRALAIREKALGPDDLDVAVSLGSMGDVALRQGKYEEAERRYQRALAIREKIQGLEHPNLVPRLLEVAHIQNVRGRRTDARAALRRALAISEKSQGEDRDKEAWAYLGLAYSHATVKERAQARAFYEQALALWQASLYASHHAVWPLVGLADLDIDEGKLASAEKRCRQGMEILEKAGNPNDPDLSYALVCLAKVALGREQGAEALALAERAVRLQEAAVSNLLSLASARFMHARALVATGGDRAEARALAERALAAYQATGDRERKETAEIQAWLARLRAP